MQNQQKYLKSVGLLLSLLKKIKVKRGKMNVCGGLGFKFLTYRRLDLFHRC